MKKMFLGFAALCAMIVFYYSPEFYKNISRDNQSSLYQSIIAMFSIFSGFVLAYMGIAASSEPVANENRRFMQAYKVEIRKRIRFSLFIFFLCIGNVFFVLLNYIFLNFLLFALLMSFTTFSLILYFYLPYSLVRLYMDILDSKC